MHHLTTLCFNNILLLFIDTGVLVTATDDITVQAASINDLTSEAFLAYPTHALGKDYFVMSYHFNHEDDPKPDGGNRHSQGPSIFGLVGFFPGTKVEITVPGEQTESIGLGQFETYQVNINRQAKHTQRQSSNTYDCTHYRAFTTNKPFVHVYEFDNVITHEVMTSM